MPAERFRNFDFCALEDADELQSIDDGFALEVIVGDYESVVRMFRDRADAGDPGSELFGGVEIVVAFVGGDGGVVRKPGIVATAVETDVADTRSGLGRGRKRAADDGLIDVAEPCVVFPQQRPSFLRAPRCVANFDDQRIVGKAFEQRREIGKGLLGLVKRKRELQEDGAEFAGSMENVKAGTDGALVRKGGAGNGVVSESLPEFGGEKEAWICEYTIDPLRGVVGAQGLVERGVDFDGVEKFGEVGGFVEGPGTGRGIDIAGPIGIGPACGTDVDSSGPRGIRREIGRTGWEQRFWFALWHGTIGAECAQSRVEGRECECQRAVNGKRVTALPRTIPAAMLLR